MKNIFTDFVLKQVVLFVTIIVILILNVGVMFRYECNCETRSRDCSVHMAIPFFIIFVLQLWTDKTLRYTFAGIESCCHVVYHMIKAALVGLLWVAFVLIEGQWYACCVSNTLCNYYRTDERRNSRVIGLSLLLVIIVVAALMSSGWKKCCEDSGSNTNNLYQKVRLDEEENMLKWIAKEKLKAQLEQRWEEEAAAGHQIALRPTGNQMVDSLP